MREHSQARGQRSQEPHDRGRASSEVRRLRLQEHRGKADHLRIATEAEVETMKPNAQIIAALEQLEAALATPENKEWLCPAHDDRNPS
jgi:hypothetical protein